jgi:hypothetical protein
VVSTALTGAGTLRIFRVTDNRLRKLEMLAVVHLGHRHTRPFARIAGRYGIA